MKALDEILQEDVPVPETEGHDATGETGTPPDGEQPPVEDPAPRMVPIEALLDERRKRQELEQQLAAPGAPGEGVPADPADAPERDADLHLEGARLDASEQAARGRYPDFEPRARAFTRLAAVDPSLIARLRTEADPAEFAYRMGAMAMELAQGAAHAAHTGQLPQSLSGTRSAGSAGENAPWRPKTLTEILGEKQTHG